MSLWLSDDELTELTGYKQKSAQIRWLQRNGVRHYIRADGRPKVTAGALEAPKVEKPEPNFAAVRRAS